MECSGKGCVHGEADCTLFSLLYTVVQDTAAVVMDPALAQNALGGGQRGVM